MEIVVLGAGVSGLTTATRLQELGYAVSVLAKDFSPNTTSDVSAAIWYPYKARPEENVRKWGVETLKEFVRLSECPETGVFLCEGKKFFYRPMGNPWWAKEVPHFRRLEKSELAEGQKDGFAFVLPVADMSTYLPYLRARFEKAGGRFEKKEIRQFNEAKADLIVNCTGLGSKQLAMDEKLFPIRGVVVATEKMTKPEFTMATDYPKGMIYVIPRKECTIMGGIADDDDWRDSATDEEAQAIHSRCVELLPQLKDLKVLKVKAGLRPGREAIRVEREGKVIHNYGHGGSGMTLSWGCAGEVCRLI